MKLHQWARAHWLNLVPEPRYASTVYTIVYTIFVLTGLVTLTVPPQTLVGALGEAGMNLVGGFFLAGGIVGMIAGAAEWWQLERWGITMMGIGLIAYLAIVVSLHFTSPGSRLTQVGIILIASSVLALRLGMIWRYPYKPRG